jgi:hypothetical protein
MESVQVGATVLGWGDILKIVLASGVVASAIGWFKDWLFKRRDRVRDAKFAAIGVIARLDLYVIQSRQNVRDYHEVTGPMDPHTHYQNWPRCSYPDLEVTEDTLKHLDAEHASDLAWLATEKALASEHLYWIYESSFDPTEVHNHKAEVVGYFGYEAHLLACKLRKSFDLPSFGHRWGVDEDFHDLHQAWKETKKEVIKRTLPRLTEVE